MPEKTYKYSESSGSQLTGSGRSTVTTESDMTWSQIKEQWSDKPADTPTEGVTAEVSDTPTEDNADGQPNSSNEEGRYAVPGSSTALYGVPPVFPEGYNDDLLRSVFMNSFPILKMRAVEADGEPDNKQVINGVKPVGEERMFMLQNSGGASYSLSNQYGPSSLENSIQGFANNGMFEFMHTFNQSRQTQRLMGRLAGAVTNAAISGGGALAGKVSNSGFGRSMAGLAGDAKDYINNLDAFKDFKSMFQSGRESILGQTVEDIAMKTFGAMLYGGKIDIPNIWNGSEGQNQQRCTVHLHCWKIDDINNFTSQILDPLEALLTYATPYVESQVGSNDGSGAGGADDIISYVNPPYIQAQVDGVFKTELGGVSDMSIQIDFKSMAPAFGGRPTLVIVDFTIVDLYNVIINTGKTPHKFAPSVAGIISNMKNHTTSHYGLNIDKKIYYSLDASMPFYNTAGSGGKAGGAGGGLGGIAGAIGAAASEVLGGAAGDIIGGALSGGISGAISGALGSLPSEVGVIAQKILGGCGITDIIGGIANDVLGPTLGGIANDLLGGANIGEAIGGAIGGIANDILGPTLGGIATDLIGGRSISGIAKDLLGQVAGPIIQDLVNQPIENATAKWSNDIDSWVNRWPDQITQDSGWSAAATRALSGNISNGNGAFNISSSGSWSI